MGINIKINRDFFFFQNAVEAFKGERLIQFSPVFYRC